LPGIDYDRPGDIKIKQRPHMAPQRPRHPDDPDFMDPDQRRLRADQARVKKAQDEYHAKQGVAEKITPPGKDDMEQYRKDTANMAKRAIVNKTPMSKNPVNEFAGGMGASSVAIAPGVGKGAKVGSLFGGSYAPKTPFNRKRKR
jgi:hypothetical protein